MEFSERNLIIGKGQIGTSLYEVFRRAKAVFIRDIDGPDYAGIDILHIAFPYSDGFIHDVSNYIEQYGPNLVIVYSTVPIGTCEKIGENVVHSPIEGRHPNLKESIEIGARWLGCQDSKAIHRAVKFWSPFVKTIRTMPKADYTEFLKLRSTAKFGINLVWTDYEAKISNDIGMDFEALKEFDADYSDLYSALGYPQFKRYILDPPKGKIGGHCIVPNAELLDKQYPNPMLKMIKRMGKKK